MPTPPVEPVLADPPPLGGRAVLAQRWSELAYFHWPYEPHVVQRLLPRDVTVDVYDDVAWVALVPFRMEDLGFPGLAPLPLVGSFPEINVRTYARCGDRRGVWFFSLDIDRMLPTLVARSVYSLPYCFGRADHLRVGRLVTSRVERRWPRRPRHSDGSGRRRSHRSDRARSLQCPL